MNSENTVSPNTIPTPTNEPLADSPSPLAEQPPLPFQETLTSEAPLLTNNPTGKPLMEMTDEELREYHARLMAHIQSPQTLLSHVKGPSPAKRSEPRESTRDISKYE
jgi:hypothetical protein